MSFLRRSTKEVDTGHLKGFTMETPLSNYDTMRASICLVKALLIFCASLGTIGSIISAFALETNMLIIVTSLLLFSLVLAFLHYNRILFNLAYPIIFFVFSYSILQYRIYVNSGFQAISNIVREHYRDYFELTYSRQTSEAISNRYMTITIAFIFLGFFLALMLNIAISNYMSTFFTIAMTFPFLQFGLYIGAIPNAIFLFMLLFSYITVMLLKRGGHFTLSENKKKDKPYTKRFDVISYKGNGRLMLETSVVSFVICLMLTGFTYPVMQSHFLETNEISAPKEKTDHFIKLLIQNGFFSFFNRYNGAGGMSDGRLGGVGSVGSDGETDLTVSFVPTSIDTIYLKGFTGEKYTQDAWLAPDYDESELLELLGPVKFKQFETYTSQLESLQAERLKNLHPDKILYGKMSIKKEEATDDHIYLPYYTQNDTMLPVQIDHSVRGKQTEKSQRYQVHYYPVFQKYLQADSPYYDKFISVSPADRQDADYMNYYDMFQKLHYKTVSEASREALAKVTAEIGTVHSEMELVEKIQAYFNKNFHYSLSPGTTPQDQDFISYFLTDQKEGYCAHFASAGTMLMRAYGFPARYVEGYVIKLSNMADATLLENENASDWLDGEPNLENSRVVTVDIPDSNAHAWTEIYIDGFGWYPVDFTPASVSADEQEENESIFSSLFSGLFDIQGGRETISERDVTGTSGTGTITRNLFLLVPSSTILIFMLCIVIGIKIRKWLLAYLAMQKACSKGDYSAYVSYHYVKLLKWLMRKNKEFTASSLPSEVFAYLTQKASSMTDDLSEAYLICEKALYSPEIITKEKADRFTKIVKQICNHTKISKR